MAIAHALLELTPAEDIESWGRFRALLDEVSESCSRAAGRVQGRDRAGLLMAAALLRLDIAELDRGSCRSPG